MRLGKSFKFYFLIISSVIYLTGTGFWIFDQFIRTQGLLGEDHHPAQSFLLHAHGISAYFFTLAFGYLLRSHVQPGLRGKKRKISGVSLLCLIGILIVSIFPILYASEGSLRSSASSIHTYLGLGIPSLFFFHFFKRKSVRVEGKT